MTHTSTMQDDYASLISLIQEKNNEIEQLKKQNAALKNQHLVLEQIFALTPNHVYWKDTNGVYLGCNDEQGKTLGFASGKDIVGKTDAELPWQEGAEFFRKVDEEVMEQRKIISIEENSVLPNGKKVVLYSTKRPLYDPYTGEVIGIIGISIDITEIKLKEKLERDQLTYVIKTIETFAGSMAHELRTPLATIHMGLQGMLGLYGKLSEGYELACQHNLVKEPIRNRKLKTLKETLSNLISQIHQCNALIDEQLDNIKRRQFSTNKISLLDINSIVKESIDEYPLLEQEKSLIEVNYDTNFEFYGDKKLTKNLLWNLLKNALHFIHECNKGKISIWIVIAKDKNELHVKDTAKGIPEESMHKIFDDFYTERKGGTGIGLSFCKMVMETYGGDIKCSSEFGKFTEFVLTFPKIVTE